MSNTSKIFLNQVTDDLVIEILKAVVPVLEAEGINYFIVGAFARDLGMTAKGYDKAPERKTRDIDLAVLVNSNEEYESLKAKVAALPGFVADENELFRFIFKQACEVDLLPFVDIANEKGEVELKAKKTFVLDIPGFREIEPWVETIETDEGISFRVSSLPGVVLLKLFAWDDRPEREKDIQDINHILKNFYFIHLEEIIETDDDLLELCRDEKYFDEAVSARYVGRQISRMLQHSPKLRDRVQRILEKQSTGYGMVKLMGYPVLKDGQGILRMILEGIAEGGMI
ncbi:MAG: hypothetical protein D6714_15450 [Bacteroidetes bacterium]|nr:MAG: hypothetical protein D6714_15450 [Bacteroidota bacterium]